MRLRLQIVAALLVAEGAAGCYEIPPVIPEGYVGSSAAPGWPPLAVYDPDAFHPRNRWFQRAFAPRGLRDEILPVHADAVAGVARKLSRVDEAEIEALLEAVDAAGQAPPASARAAVTDAVFRTDVLAEASRLRAEGAASARLVAACRREARRASLPDALAPLLREAVPPPLRDGDWTDEAAPDREDLLPSPRDPRWTRFIRRRDKGGLALVRMRTALGPDGACVLLPLAGECWDLAKGTDGAGERHWRFDRAEWVQGREPWRLVGGDESFAIGLGALDAGPRTSVPQEELARRALEPVSGLSLSPSARSPAAPSAAAGSGDGSPARAQPR